MYVNPNIEKIVRVPQPEGRGAYLRLDQNENVDGVPKWLFDEAMKKVTPEFLSIYPEESVLTEKYAKLVGVEPNNVSLTDGSVVGMGYIIKVFGEPGKKLLCVTPSFAMYKVYAEMIGMSIQEIEYEDDFTMDINNILDNIDRKTGIVVLVNPNMPVGNVYTKEEIESVIVKAKENDAYVIIDEAYYYFFDETSIPLTKKYDNLFVLRTFSKMLSIPSLRLGTIVSSSKNIVHLENYKPHYTVNSIALLFGEAIVDNHDRLLKELTENFRNGQKRIMELIKENDYEYIEGKGCYVCIKPKHKDSRTVTDELKENGILILCGKDGLTGYLRVTITGAKYMDRFFDALLKIDR